MNAGFSELAALFLGAGLIGWMIWNRWLGMWLVGVRSLDAAEYFRKMREEKPVVLDVRSPAEWADGHPKGALLIPLHELNLRLDEIPRGRPIVCICASGLRSAKAARLLARAGYAPVFNFRGGFAAWNQAGLPVRRGREGALMRWQAGRQRAERR